MRRGICPPCADGPIAGCSACGAGRPDTKRTSFRRRSRRVLSYSADRGKRIVGSPHGRSAVADGWGCILCIEITNPASWWTQTKTFSSATAVDAAET